MEPDRPVTQLLLQWSGGNEAALAELTTLLYNELRAMAARHLRRERPNHTIQRTALVHEAFVRLVDQRSIDWRDRSHFFALASNVMRRILVDHARARLASKRGGGAVMLSFEEVTGPTDPDNPTPSRPDAGVDIPNPDGEGDDIEAIDGALTHLAALDPRQAQIVEMRYFGGLTIEETAQALGISDATVKREWTAARAWLRRELSRGS
ncbi:MAG TPA: sigma-70 family RNA polymerase sigma factor [Steroidobacteraceae bacterium]|jgi:RNA polymerase sigma factor (sigma-70 family)